MILWVFGQVSTMLEARKQGDKVVRCQENVGGKAGKKTDERKEAGVREVGEPWAPRQERNRHRPGPTFGKEGGLCT